MGMGTMLFILLVLQLCIIHGSAGLALHSTIASPTPKHAALSPTIQGLVPSTPPSPIVLPSHKSARLAPYIPASPPIIVPSRKSTASPQTMPLPMIPSSHPPVVPSQKSAPLPQTMPRVTPSITPSPPSVVPSDKSVPLPQIRPWRTPPILPSPPIVVPSQELAPLPQNMPRLTPSMSPSAPIIMPSNKSTPLPQIIPQLAPSMPPSTPVVEPSQKLAPLPPKMPGLVPSMPPNDSSHRKAPEIQLPITVPRAQVPVASLPRESPKEPPAMHSTIPGVAPSGLSEPVVPPISAPPSISSRKENGMRVAASPKETFNHLAPMNHSPKKGSFPVLAPVPHTTTRSLNSAPSPSVSSSEHSGRKSVHSPAPLPSTSVYNHHARKRASSAPPTSFHPIVPPVSHQGPSIIPSHSPTPTASPKKNRQRHHNILLPNHGPSPVQPPFPTTSTHGAPAPLPSSIVPISRTKGPVLPPMFSHPESSPMKPKATLPPHVQARPPPPPNIGPVLAPMFSPPEYSPMKAKATLPPNVQALPPPPPNLDCTSLTCSEPLTNSPPGSPCECVCPIKVGLRLSVALYTFFPLVSKLAEEIASGVFMKQSQVRIMGANAASQQLDKTDVLVDLVPLGEKFDNTTAFLTYEKFWQKQVSIQTSFFGDYEVLYVSYPGLPPSPPSAPSSINTIDGPYLNQGNNARAIHPLGVDVRRKQKSGLGGSTIAIIVLSSFAAVVLCIGAAWFLLLKHGDHTVLAAPTQHTHLPSLAKQPGAGGSMFGSGLSSTSLSFGSCITTYTGSARTFSAEEVEKATNKFDASRIIGEGGFGRVYKGVLEDGTEVAIKVLKRDDHQGGCEFLAEVEMLSRLHHRNLVKLIGICIEEHTRCLMYELIPNGSVESHLHGVDKESGPLDWDARMKIALGAARGLAYLHEDSSPHVIHRDFKSSNILLEHDFTPKVSDFGLAKTALDGGHKHISTRVMGTFGYVAPEYAMTGHLLVKSDVYSYGVVLLELLTGRKPVDMSQPQGQENLVAWARPLLTSKEGLEIIVDPALGFNFPFDSVAKVAAIASMCVQPEVSHRPFMGEVVQALKLVCNECDEAKEAESESYGQEDVSVADIDTRTSTGSGQLAEHLHARSDYDSIVEADRTLSASFIFSSSERFGRHASGSFRRHSSSGPLRTGRSRQFWQRIRGLSRGSVSEHGVALRL